MARTPKLKLPVDLVNEIASTRDGQDITQPWTTALKQPRDPRLLGAVDWGAYDELRRDDRVKSCVEQRIRAVVSAEWDVLPGDEHDARSVEAAEKLKANLEAIGIDRTTEKMGWACFYGYQVAEVLWGQPVDGIIPIAALKVRHARRFRYDKDEKLRLITRGNSQGVLVPDRKFWVVRTGATNDDELYGEGLAYWLYWPVYFKRNAVRFWNIFLKKFGNPTIKATYRRGTPKEDIGKILAMIQSASEDSGFAVPEGVLVELLQATRSGTGDYSAIYDKMDAAIATIILSQTMTTQDGASHSQAKVHANVKLEIVKADADMNCESFNAGPARWWTDMNYGPEVSAPILVRLVDEEADLKLLAETDTILAGQGWVRTEESFNDTYGDGYERKVEATPPVATPAKDAPPAKPGEAPPAANDDPAAEAAKKAASFAEAGQGDVIDQIAGDLLAAQGWRPLSPQLKAILDAIEASGDPAALDDALLKSLDNADATALTNILARAGFATRIAAEAGVQ